MKRRSFLKGTAAAVAAAVFFGDTAPVEERPPQKKAKVHRTDAFIPEVWAEEIAKQYRTSLVLNNLVS